MRIGRILAIVMLLLEKERVGAAELASRFEVSLRTVYRDIEAINMAGIPVWSQPGPGGGVGIMPQYKVEKRIFTSDDILALLTALGFVSGAVAPGEIAPALAKIQSLLPGGAPDGADPLLFDASGWMGVDVGTLVGLLHGAIRGRHPVLFSYLGQAHRQNSRVVEPYRLLFKQNSWYLQGWCRLRGGLRLFKLARMWDVEMLEEIFTPRSLPPIPDEYTRRMEAAAIPVRLRLRHQTLDRMLEYVQARDLRLVENGCYEVDFDFVPDDYGYGLLLSFGTGCECLAPDTVREELARRLEDTLRLYRAP